MPEEDTEKRFHSIMDKLFHSPKPKSKSTSSPGNQSSSGKKRVWKPDSGRNAVSLGGLNRSLVPIGSLSASDVPICRPWDRGDLLKRLATFKSMTWFGKPKVVSAVNCARRGWINIEMDIIACEACGARLLFSTPSSWAQQQIEKAAAVFSLKLDSGHKLLCPWIDNACDEALTQFPPTSAAALVDGYRERLSVLMQLSALPAVSSSVFDYMTPQLEGFLDQSSSWEFGLGSGDATRIECVGRQTSSCNLYYQALKLISLCGWEPRSLPYVVDCKDWSTQATTKRNSKESSQIANGQSPGVTMCSVSGADDEINEDRPSLSGQQSDPASVVLDCKLCGSSVGLWAFPTTPRPLELFRIVESSEGNSQNDLDNFDASIINCIAGSPGTNDSGKDDPGGHNSRKLGTNTFLKERPLNLSIAGGPPPAKQNYRATVSLPIITRHLRTGLPSNSGVRVYSIHQETIQDHLQITNSFAQEKDHSTSSEVIRQSKDIGKLKCNRNEDDICISGDDGQSLLNHESHDDSLRIKKNVDSPSEKDHTTPHAQEKDHTDAMVENPSEWARQKQHEDGVSAGNAEIGAENNSEVNACSATVSDFNGITVSGETNHVLDACSDFMAENPVESMQTPEDAGSEGNTGIGIENSSCVKECRPDDTVVNGDSGEMSIVDVCSGQLTEIISESSTRPHEISSEARQEPSIDASSLRPNATPDISCEMNRQKDDTGTNCQNPSCIQGTTEKYNTTPRSVINEVSAVNGLVKDLKQVQSDQAMEFDPIRQHRHFCPWIVAIGRTAPGWQQTLSALHRARESSCLSPSENPSLSMLEVEDPVISIRKLFTSPSAKRMKTTHDSR